VRFVKPQDAIERIDGNGLGMGREGRGLAEGAPEAAAAGRKKHADRNGPAAGKAKFGNERGVLDLVERRVDELRERFFAIAREDVIERGLDRGSKRAVVPCPELRNAGGAGFASHVEDVVGFFEVEGEANGVPSLAKLSGILGPGRVLEDGDARDVLTEEAKTKRYASRHSETPTEIARSVFAEVIVETSVATTGGKKDSRHCTLLHGTVWTGRNGGKSSMGAGKVGAGGVGLCRRGEGGRYALVLSSRLIGQSKRDSSLRSE
jgi:hypothetical protein